MEYVCTLSIPYTDNIRFLDCNYWWGHGILGLKGLNPSIFHHWYNHTNVDLVHHIYSFFHYHDHPYDGTNTNSKYPFGLQVSPCFARFHLNYLNLLHPSTENSFSFYFFEIITYILLVYTDTRNFWVPTRTDTVSLFYECF